MNIYTDPLLPYCIFTVYTVNTLLSIEKRKLINIVFSPKIPYNKYSNKIRAGRYFALYKK